MFWTIYSAGKDRIPGRSEMAESTCETSHTGTLSGGKTVQQLFFMIEDLADIGADRPAPATR